MRAVKPPARGSSKQCTVGWDCPGPGSIMTVSGFPFTTVHGGTTDYRPGELQTEIISIYRCRLRENSVFRNNCQRQSILDQEEPKNLLYPQTLGPRQSLDTKCCHLAP